MKPGDNRTEKYSLQMISQFDVRENAAIGGGSDYDCEEGVLSSISGIPARSKYYCRGIYNPTAGVIVVNFKVFEDSTTYTARIASGSWYMAYGYIRIILNASTTSSTVTLTYSNRGKVDATGTL
jgi:hypothetical protein